MRNVLFLLAAAVIGYYMGLAEHEFDKRMLKQQYEVSLGKLAVECGFLGENI
ncbi:hypothetical protein [Zhongshania sp.]|uniref:hypothetical protein n=1 Tax=Zhongshania sp. TaxID=1971902 RepID=UPI003569059D